MKVFQRLKTPTFYLLFTFVHLCYFAGALIVFKMCSLTCNLFLYLVVGAYPIICLWEQSSERALENRHKKETERGLSFNFVSGEDIKYIEGHYSLNAALFIGFIAVIIILMRIINPEFVELQSAGFAGWALGLSVYIYRKRTKSISGR